jgi:hypothetical protein
MHLPLCCEGSDLGHRAADDWHWLIIKLEGGFAGANVVIGQRGEEIVVIVAPVLVVAAATARKGGPMAARGQQSTHCVGHVQLSRQ